MVTGSLFQKTEFAVHKMMQSLLRGFHRVGKAYKFLFVLFFIRWWHFSRFGL